MQNIDSTVISLCTSTPTTEFLVLLDLDSLVVSALTQFSSYLCWSDIICSGKAENLLQLKVINLTLLVKCRRKTCPAGMDANYRTL